MDFDKTKFSLSINELTTQLKNKRKLKDNLVGLPFLKVQCVGTNCSKVFSNPNSYKAHIKACHLCEIRLSPSPNLLNNNDGNKLWTSLDGGDNYIDDYTDKFDAAVEEAQKNILKIKNNVLQNIVSSFVSRLSKLRINCNMSNKVMDEIGQCFVSMFKCLRLESANHNKLDTDMAFDVLEDICQNSTKQDQLVRSLSTFVEPKFANVGKFEFIYVPVKKLARRMLNDSLVESIINEKDNTENCIQSELDTTDPVRRHRIMKKLRIEAYYDEYTIGSGKNVKKLMASYLSNGNLELDERSRRADSNLFLLADCDKMKKHGITTNDVFQLFVNDMLDLGSKGINYQLQNG